MSVGWQVDVESEARHVLGTSYDIRPRSIERLARDSPNQIWRCTTSDGRYTLKRLGRPGQDRWLAFQDAAIARAAQCGVPTEPLIRAVDGSPTASANGALWQLRRYVPGRHFRDGDPADLRAAAEMVAAVHAVPVDGLPQPGANPIQDMEFWLGADESAIDELGKLVSASASPAMWDEVHETYRDAYRRARAALDLPTYQSLPATLTHGEMAGSNLVFDDEGKLISLLDWDGVDIRPRAYDLARAMLFLARAGRGASGSTTTSESTSCFAPRRRARFGSTNCARSPPFLSCTASRPPVICGRWPRPARRRSSGIWVGRRKGPARFGTTSGRP
ncbi:aminoglycoside phosphotransferase family protein [Streptomyces malaysiensis subsp. malaysiensis]